MSYIFKSLSSLFLLKCLFFNKFSLLLIIGLLILNPSIAQKINAEFSYYKNSSYSQSDIFNRLNNLNNDVGNNLFATKNKIIGSVSTIIKSVSYQK